MQKYSTDHIAKLAHEAIRDHWKIFVLLPLIPLGIATILGALVVWFSRESLQEILIYLELLYGALILAYMVYGTAVSKWCEALFLGQTELKIKEELHYGLSRLGGVIGTALLTGIKLILWTLLFILPGIYKFFMYSQSIQISRLEKISGGDAHRLSQKLIKEAGILRTFGNYMTLTMLVYLSFLALWLVMLLVMIPFGLLNQNTGLNLDVGIAIILGSLIFFFFYLYLIAFIECFLNFQYLCFREENKIAFQKTIKTLQSIKG